MSNVTNILLKAAVDETKVVEMNSLLPAEAQLASVGEHAGGTKNLEAQVWLCAANQGVGFGTLRQMILAISWDRVECISLGLQGQDEDVMQFWSYDQLCDSLTKGADLWAGG